MQRWTITLGVPVMHNLEPILRVHPHQPSDMDLIQHCVEACFACAQTCTVCADACMSEPNIAELRECIRVDMDCADVCVATGRVVARLNRPHRTPMKALLTACIEACRTCAEQCSQHAGMHEHCRICAQTCVACEQACASLHKVIP
jgi:hypothetical protein